MHLTGKGKMKRKLIILTVIVTTLVLIFCGCGEAEEEEPEKKGLEKGYKAGEGGLLPRDLCAYRSEVNVFPVNDVTLYYSFGWLYSIYPPEESVVDLYFINLETEDYHYIKTIYDYNTEEYCFTYWNEDGEYVDERFFNHTELLTIPEELFVGKKGTIRLSLRTEERSFGWGGDVHYYRTGDTVFLSETYIK